MKFARRALVQPKKLENGTSWQCRLPSPRLALALLSAVFGMSCGAQPGPAPASQPALSKMGTDQAFVRQSATPEKPLARNPGQRLAATLDVRGLHLSSTLTAADGASNDALGSAVAIDGDTAVVGAAFKTVGGNVLQGQVYIFVWSGTSWSEQAVLTASDAAAYDGFGSAVAISGDTVVIGALGKQVGTNRQQGQSYVFVRSGSSWSEQAILVDTAGGGVNDQFGNSVSVRGNTAVVGARGKTIGTKMEQGQAYVYVRSGTSWAQQAILVDSATGAAFDAFANSVALSGDTIVVGAPYRSYGTHYSQGQVYVYVRSGTAWSQQALLVDAAAGEMNDTFGQAVALDGDTVLVGAPGKGVATHVHQGQAYVYARTGISWTQQAVLVDTAAGTDFDACGFSVAVLGDAAVVAAYSKTVGASSEQGQAYTFIRSGTTWAQQDVLADAAGETGDSFGFAVAMSGKLALIGAPGKRIGMNRYQGQVYVFQQPGAPDGAPCTLGTLCTSGFCIDGVCCDTACGGGKTTDCRSCLGAHTGGADGTCAAIVPAANYICRQAAAVCDQPEYCDGLSDSCPADGLYQLADRHLCRAATSCSRESYCDGSSARCPPTLCLPPRF